MNTIAIKVLGYLFICILLFYDTKMFVYATIPRVAYEWDKRKDTINLIAILGSAVVVVGLLATKLHEYTSILHLTVILFGLLGLQAILVGNEMHAARPISNWNVWLIPIVLICAVCLVLTLLVVYGVLYDESFMTSVRNILSWFKQQKPIIPILEVTR